MHVTLRGLISTMASFLNSYLTSRQRLIRSDFRNKALAITLWSALPFGKQRNKTAYTGICATRFECDRNRASTSARGFLSCQEHVLPLARPGREPLSPPSTPDGPLAVALSENMDRPWQYCRRNHPASPPAWYTRPHFIYSIVSKFSDPFVRLNL